MTQNLNSTLSNFFILFIIHLNSDITLIGVNGVQLRPTMAILAGVTVALFVAYRRPQSPCGFKVSNLLCSISHLQKIFSFTKWHFINTFARLYTCVGLSAE